MPIQHKSGDKMYVDYAGAKLCYVDEDTGEIKTQKCLWPFWDGASMRMWKQFPVKVWKILLLHVRIYCTISKVFLLALFRTI
jgi:hypothetical protein